jgi:putative ABC transport system substrate-binding protein
MGVGQTNRRAFIVGLLGSAAWPFCVRAQKNGPMRHVAVLLPLREGEGIGKPGVAVFQQALQKLGWGLGRNLRISVHYAGPDREGTRAGAAELVRMMPDIILTMASPATAAVLAQTRTIPIVFVHVSDPVTGGLVDSLAHPGANATGFTNLDPSLGGKWAELLKEIAPSVKRAALMFNSEALPQAEYFVRSFEAATRWLVIEPSATLVRDDVDIERVIADLAGGPSGGLVVLPDTLTYEHRAAINRLTVRYRVPAVNGSQTMTEEGGLVAYAVDGLDLFHRGATYVDRILKGDRAGTLPVQAPIKFELVINLKTAEALGLDVPHQLLTRADEVIE